MRTTKTYAELKATSWGCFKLWCHFDVLYFLIIFVPKAWYRTIINCSNYFVFGPDYRNVCQNLIDIKPKGLDA